MPGDTLQVVAVFQRVAFAIIEKLFAEYYSPADTLPPTDEQRKRFRASLSRVHQELKDTDTAFFWVVGGPRVIRFRTSRQNRDSVALMKVMARTRTEFQRIIADASFSSLSAANYSSLAKSGLDGGGAVSALLDPGPGGWYQAGGSMEIQCEGKNGVRVTREKGYVLNSLGVHETDKALCLWSGDSAREWNDVEPNAFTIRLIGIIRKDTLFGPWINIPSSSFRR